MIHKILNLEIGRLDCVKMFKILECLFHIDPYVIRNELLRYKKTRVNT